ncbi:Dopamine D2-like receptor [Strongyloides ratti]|uniref:Dopamine D2-like receptor n=1 Tax=Strongyloides ratti TaxID=34506 RepID=A0A090MVH7_STRRB|nr:Dopamine D2-like receptor [Strongyloides ratti]CEF62913.1 Dopamine D2-like receptor [Strongyloides ratti]
MLIALIIPLICRGKISNYDYPSFNKLLSFPKFEDNVNQIDKRKFNDNETIIEKIKPEVIGFRANSYDYDLSKDMEQSPPALIYTLFLCLIPLATVIGNVLIIVAVLRFKTLHTAINFLILGLAVADLLVALFVMPFAVYVYMHDGNWLLGSRMCDMYTAGDVACSTASILLLAVISFDRYRAVSSPIEYSRQSKNIKRVLLILLAIWIISFSLASPIVLGVNEPPPDASQNECRLYSASFSISSSIISFVIPCFIVLFVYIRIMVALRKRQKAAKMRRAANGGCGVKNDRRSFRLRSFKNQTNDLTKDEASRIVSAPAVSMMMMALPSMSKRMQKMEKSNKIIESTITEDDYEEDDNNSVESDESTYESCMDDRRNKKMGLPMVSNLARVLDSSKSYNLLFSSIGLSKDIKDKKNDILRRKSFAFKKSSNFVKCIENRRHSSGNITINPTNSTSTYALFNVNSFSNSKSSFICKSVPQVLSNIHSLLKATSIQSLILPHSLEEKSLCNESYHKPSYTPLHGNNINLNKRKNSYDTSYHQTSLIPSNFNHIEQVSNTNKPVFKLFDYDMNVSSDLIDNPIELACEKLNVKECENQSVPLDSSNPLYSFQGEKNLPSKLENFPANRFVDTSKSTTSVKSTEFDESISLTKNSASSDYSESLSNVEIEKPKSEKKSNFFSATARRYTLAKIPGREITQHGDKLLKNVINKFYLKKHSHSIDVPNLLEQVNSANLKKIKNDMNFELYKNYNFIPTKESPLINSYEFNGSSKCLELNNVIKNEYIKEEDNFSIDDLQKFQEDILAGKITTKCYSTAPLAKSEFDMNDDTSGKSSLHSFDNCPSTHTILYGLETLNDPALCSLHEFDNMNEMNKDDFDDGILLENEYIIDDIISNASNESSTECQSIPSNSITFQLSMDKSFNDNNTRKTSTIAKQVSLPIQPSLIIHSPEDVENERRGKNPKLTISASNIEIGFNEIHQNDEINTKSSYESETKLSVASKMLEIKNKFFSHSEDNFQKIVTKKNGQKSVKRKESSMKRKANKVQRKEKRATKTLGIVVGTFLICWVPFFSLNIINGICNLIEAESCQVGFNPFFYTTWIGYMNSFMNPIIYSIFNTEFRRAFKSILTGNNNGNRNRWVLTRTS